MRRNPAALAHALLDFAATVPPEAAAPVLRQAARVKRKLANLLEHRRAQRVAGACRAWWRCMRAVVRRKESRRRRPLGRVVMVTPAAADDDSSTERAAAAAAASAKAAEEERSAYRGLML